MDQLGLRLQRFRLKNGWSKRAIAQQLGVSIPSIMRWEDGTSVPNDYNRYKIEQLISAPPVDQDAIDEAQLDLFAQPQRESTSAKS